MSDTLTTDKLRLLPVAERLRLLEAVWESLADEPDSIEIPDWHREELGRRLEAYRKNPGDLRSWDDIEARLLAKSKK